MINFGLLGVLIKKNFMMNLSRSTVYSKISSIDKVKKLLEFE